ncbi:MAG: NADH-quinone oxidoreductase subunit N, partial [Chloroflexi bacterium]|nr:NADH-quinone oxidoreductase subunit N [Chloroflexota bacterium]
MQIEDLTSILPEIILTLIAAAVLMVDAFGGRRTHHGLMGLIVVGSVVAILVSVVLRADSGTAFGGMVLTDGYAVFFKVLFIAIAALSIVLAYAQSSEVPFAELSALILFATVGMLLLGATGDLITLYLGVELTSIPVYVLVAIKRDRFRATEGALKYFLLGAFASGVLLYGIAWLFGLTGTTNLANIALYVQSQGADNPWFLLGLG